MNSKWQKELSLSLGVVLLALLAYGHLFERGATPYTQYSDLIAQHLAMKQVAYHSLQLGQGLPLWKTDLLAGGPALTHPQALFTNPLQLLFLVLKPTTAAGPTIWLHLVAMALSMLVLGAAMGLGYPARIFMAVAGLFSFKMIMLAYSGWLPVLPGLVLTPLLFAGIFRVMDQPSPSAGLLLATAGSLALHCGHLQFFYYSTLFLAVYLAVQLTQWLRAGATRHASHVVMWCLVSAILASYTAAYLLLPLAADTALTSRVGSSYDFFLSRGGYPPENLLTFIHPEALGTPLDGSYAHVELWEDVAYFGVVPLALALVGLVLGAKRRHGRFFIVTFCVSIFLVFDTPILRLLFDFVPGFSFFRHPSRFLFLTTLLGIPLAGIGLQESLMRLERRRAASRFPWLPHVLLALLVIVMVGEGYYYAKRYVRMAPADRVIPSTDYARFFDSDSSTFRVAPIGRYTLNYGWASFMHLELVTGFDAYNYRHYEQYLGMMTRNEIVPDTHIVWTDVNTVKRWDLLAALNIKYLVTTGELARPQPGLELAARFENQPVFAFYHGLSTATIYIYEYESVLPRVYWARKLLPARSSRETLELALHSDLRKSTIVEVPDAAPVQPAIDENRGVRIIERRGGHHVFETHNAQRGFAVIGEIWHPGWRATLDGEPLPLYRANIAMMGAWIPEGEHRLEIEFQPLHWTRARLITLAGLAGMIGLAALSVRGRQRG